MKRRKKNKTLPLPISIEYEEALDKVSSPGYFLGKLLINGVGFHIEAIEAKEVKDNLPKARYWIYQNRIDSWGRLNEQNIPHLVKIGRKKYFFHIEVWAQ